MRAVVLNCDEVMGWRDLAYSDDFLLVVDLSLHHEVSDFLEGVDADFSQADYGQQLCLSLIVEGMRLWKEVECDNC